MEKLNLQEQKKGRSFHVETADITTANTKDPKQIQMETAR
jgi:hypothetical protein